MILISIENNQHGYREHINCYFQDNTKIESINNIVCLDKDETVMGRAFLEFDKAIIREILKRPFKTHISGGKRKQTKKNIIRSNHLLIGTKVV